MAKYIVEIRNPADDSDRRLIEWSTVSDAPETPAMTREEFSDYYEREYGRRGMLGLPGRLARVDERGTSQYGADDWLDTITVNRSGPNETQATPAEIWHMCMGWRDD